TLLAACLWLALRSLRAPAARYFASCAALGLMAIAPVLTFATLCAKPPELHAVLPAFASPASPASPASFDPRTIALALWAIGALAMIVRLAAGLVEVRAIVRSARPLVAWEARAAAIAHRFGVRRRVRVVESARVAGPGTVGWIRPVILLPVALA